ncbi:SRPBCC family protein [Phaeobacter sp. B1627]|uniref:SRPBCC family protein n=1 Tax=Phaeobacter sp. B1627 TaxID=2583809 RepID=UPI001117FCA6|nr:SRPBCC family protein [Phaeobacter sp. B1627]TNJ47574.1 SRPBCC family protein [Phaeobacter sp. B1627]
MHFETREDIDSPIETMFAAVTDFETFERSALRRGIEVQRKSGSAEAISELAWDVGFEFRGTKREMQLSVAECDAPTSITLVASGNGMTGEMKVDLLALSPRRTRMTVRIELSPKTLAARLLVQSLKLARNKLNRKFSQRVAEFARMAAEGRDLTA